jgi:hypothetical protein
MLDMVEIDEIATKAALAVLQKERVARVFTTPTVDSGGNDALRVTIVLPDETADSMNGDLVLDTIVKIGDDLRLAGEDRLSLVKFATEDEVAADNDPDVDDDSEL